MTDPTGWNIVGEPVDTSWVGFMPLNFDTNPGVPIAWTVPTGLSDIIEEPS